MGYIHLHMVGMPGFILIRVSIFNLDNLQMFRVIHLFFQQPHWLLVLFSVSASSHYSTIYYGYLMIILLKGNVNHQLKQWSER